MGYKVEYTGPPKDAVKGLGHIYLVPDLSKNLYIHHQPVVGADECPTCGIIHLCKTIHLTLDGLNRAIVSLGVFEHLERIGLRKNNLRFVGIVKDPPTLTVNGRLTRRQVDQRNEKITHYG